jgi:hypothetical protein
LEISAFDTLRGFAADIIQILLSIPSVFIKEEYRANDCKALSSDCGLIPQPKITCFVGFCWWKTT